MHDELLDVDIDSLDPICAVTGFFVMNVGAMERVLFTASTALGITKSFAIAEELGGQRLIPLLRDVAPRLSEGDELLTHLDVAADALDLRHAVVHGILIYDEEKDHFDSHRPPRGAKRRGQADPANPSWIRHRFRMTDLFQTAKDARRVSGFVLDRMAPWHDSLNLTEGDNSPTR